LPQNFQILDSEDQKRLLKQVIRSLELDDKALRAKDVVADDNYSNKMLKIYFNSVKINLIYNIIYNIQFE